MNKVFILGRLGRSPELRRSANGNFIANFSLATSEKRKDSSSGGYVQTTEWHKVTVFGKTAENSAKYLHKGSKALVEGRIKTEKWQDKDGGNRSSTVIIAQSVQFLDSKEEAQELSNSSQNPQIGSAEVTATAQARGVQAADATSFDDDDIPF